jgi:hypothetical protein
MRALISRCGLAVLLTGVLLVAASAQQQRENQQADDTRGVRLLDPTLPPPPALPEFTPAPPPVPPSAPAQPDLASPGSPPPAETAPAAGLNEQPSGQPSPAGGDAGRPALSAVAPASPAPAASQPAPVAEPSLPQQADVADVLRQLPNTAGLSLTIAPSDRVPVGQKLTIRVVTRKTGYLILVDIDATGRLTQIFPNPRSLLMARGSPRSANEIRPGRAISIPDPSNPFAGFQFIATPPTGTALLVALLSNRPVQVLDLPDVPPSLVGQAAALTYVRDMARRLKIAQLNGPLEDIDWSFDAKFYQVQ